MSLKYTEVTIPKEELGNILSYLEREVLILRYEKHFTYKEIAEILAQALYGNSSAKKIREIEKIAMKKIYRHLKAYGRLNGETNASN